jgi:hypothetical protein
MEGGEAYFPGILLLAKPLILDISMYLYLRTASRVLPDGVDVLNCRMTHKDSGLTGVRTFLFQMAINVVLVSNS